MAYPPRPRHVPYAQQPRRRRKASYIWLRNHLRSEAARFGGKFVADALIEGEVLWVDAWFPSRRLRRMFYNLELIPVRMAYMDALHDLAWKQSYELAPERDDYSLKTVRSGKYTHRVIFPEWKHYPELDGLTRFDWIDRQERILADSGAVQVFEKWTLHRDYACGIGLHAAIDVPNMTVDAVNDFIERFLHTEQEFCGSVPYRWSAEEIFSWRERRNAAIEAEHKEAFDVS